MIRTFLLLAAACLLIISCADRGSVTGEADLGLFSADSVKKDVAILASDEYEGRMPFTRSEEKTIHYLRDRFSAMGLEPGNGSSWFQDVPMVNILSSPAAEMRVKGSAGSFSLKGFDDYVINTYKTDSLITLDNTEVVFAGYGVNAPEHNWNDYANIDVRGKIVLVLVNDPGFNSGDSTLFKGKTMTYYGRWTYKYEEAARQGAKGCLIIHTTKAASYPFNVVQNSWNNSQLQLDNRNKTEQYCDVVGWISKAASNRLLAAAGVDSSIIATADTRGFKAVPLPVALSTTMKVTATYNKTRNVIAKITGSKRPGEVIIYTAHWDHLGIGKPDETGDSIYNGALDNASGTAGLLELARVFKNMKDKPERTLVFLAVTAEEQGLWGSAYYAQNPVYPADKTVANINMDGINPYEKTRDIVVVGKGQSELEDYLTEVTGKLGRYVAFETHPEAGYYYRSDHFNFAKVGIPALYLKTGVDVIGKGKEFGEQRETTYRAKHYHRPSDAFDPSSTFAGGIEDLKLLFLVGKKLAFEDNMPGWKEGSEFKKLRK